MLKNTKLNLKYIKHTYHELLLEKKNSEGSINNLDNLEDVLKDDLTRVFQKYGPVD